MAVQPVVTPIRCYHCGDACNALPVRSEDKSFCCDGCKTVYELLSENGLCNYYALGEKAGITIKRSDFNGKYAYLDDPNVTDKLLTFKDDEVAHVTFHLPNIHCSSCIWLLEHLYRLDEGITQSRSDFMKKELAVEFDYHRTSLRKVVELLVLIGYEPSLHLDDLEKKKAVHPQRQRIYRIAVAGFCFSNIMLLSFPEYFHIAHGSDLAMQRMFGYINLVLSLPVLLYSGAEFYLSAWKGIRARFLNIDLPLTLSIAITFGRSLYDILTGIGIGYLDSMSGIIFFMLIGRYFQEKTYFNLQFNRNYKSYFPISVSVRKENEEYSMPLSDIKKGDRMIVRSQELIPADSVLMSEVAFVDYSFVTGESEPVRISRGQIIYAGGKNTGATVEMVVEKEVKQSYLTSLWNKDAFQEEKDAEEQSFVHKLARNFTVVLLLLSVGGLIYWWSSDFQRGLNALTTVLIVACPCALLLSATFTHGTVLRIFSSSAFYLKNALVIEKLRTIDLVVFDKTGTITAASDNEARFVGEELTNQERAAVFALVNQSLHPLSKTIARSLYMPEVGEVSNYLELPGKGISGTCNGRFIRLGSPSFLGLASPQATEETRSWLEVNGKPRGYFAVQNVYREGLEEVVDQLSQDMELAVVSGDNESEKAHLLRLFPKSSILLFHKKPEDKLAIIESFQNSGKKVAMVGDGLNDAGALRQSNVGIAISESVNNFSPACDVIMEAKAFADLPKLFAFARRARWIILGSFAISLLYNVIGVSIALSGEMQPVVAAILMPVSSITIVLFTSGVSWLAAKGLKLG
jgi:P-type Cu+ transporter